MINKITKSKIGIMVDDVSSVSTFSLTQVDKTAIGETNADTHIIGIIKKQTWIKEKDITELIIWIDIRHLLGTINHTVRSMGSLSLFSKKNGRYMMKAKTRSFNGGRTLYK